MDRGTVAGMGALSAIGAASNEARSSLRVISLLYARLRTNVQRHLLTNQKREFLKHFHPFVVLCYSPHQSPRSPPPKDSASTTPRSTTRLMTTPPRKLKMALEPGVCLQLRDEAGDTLGMLEYTEAMRRAVRGEVEGVGGPNGRIRYLRVLPEAARELPDLEAEQEIERAKASAINAQTNIGAYRQHLSVGSVWALCALRNVGI